MAIYHLTTILPSFNCQVLYVQMYWQKPTNHIVAPYPVNLKAITKGNNWYLSSIIRYIMFPGTNDKLIIYFVA